MIIKNRPLVSVIVTTFDCEKFIAEALDSVIAQTYSNLEIIVVDDGSTDKTSEVVNGFIKKDKRVKLFQLEHCGRPSIPRNYGIGKSSGELIAFLDGDDIWVYTKIHDQVRRLNENPSCVMLYSMSVTFGAVNFFSPMYEVLPLIHKKALTKDELIQNGNCIPTSTTIIRSAPLKSIGGFDEDPRLKIEDFDLWIRLGNLGNYCFMPRIQTYYRVHKNQFSGAWEEKRSNLKYLAEKHNLKIPTYKFYRNKGFFFLMLRNSFHFLHFFIAGLGDMYDSIKAIMLGEEFWRIK